MVSESKMVSGAEPVESMTNSQKILILLVLISSLYFLFSIARYWLADVHYATGQKNYQFFAKIQDSQYLISSFQSLQSAVKANPSEPAILSEYAVSAAYLSAALAAKDSSTAAQLAQTAAFAANRAVSLNPRHPNYYKSAARAYILLSAVDSRYLQLAADTLQKAVLISPADPRIPYNLGIIYKYLNATESAKTQFQKSLELKPDFADAKKQLHAEN